MRVDAAPDGTLRGDLHRIRSYCQHRKAEPFKLRRPRALIGEDARGLFSQTIDQDSGQPSLSHVFIRFFVEHVIGMTGPKQVKKVQPALR